VRKKATVFDIQRGESLKRVKCRPFICGRSQDLQGKKGCLLNGREERRAIRKNLAFTTEEEFTSETGKKGGKTDDAQD